MLLDNVELFLCQFSWFLEDFIWNPKFSNIMKIACDFHHFAFFFIHSRMLCQSIRGCRNTGGMHRCKRAAKVYDSGHKACEDQSLIKADIVHFTRENQQELWIQDQIHPHEFTLADLNKGINRLRGELCSSLIFNRSHNHFHLVQNRPFVLDDCSNSIRHMYCLRDIKSNSFAEILFVLQIAVLYDFNNIRDPPKLIQISNHNSANLCNFLFVLLYLLQRLRRRRQHRPNVMHQGRKDCIMQVFAPQTHHIADLIRKIGSLFMMVLHVRINQVHGLSQRTQQ